MRSVATTHRADGAIVAYPIVRSFPNSFPALAKLALNTHSRASGDQHAALILFPACPCMCVYVYSDMLTCVWVRLWEVTERGKISDTF